MNINKSPYLANPNRLADVIAAIQVMGTYKFYKLDFRGWADRIEGDETRAEHWRAVVEEHPEFFRMDSKREKASLVWRRQRQKRFDVDTQAEITKEAFLLLSDERKARVSRVPLTSDELETLVDAAIKLHSTALEQQKDRRWWIPVITTLAAVLVGAISAPLARLSEKRIETHKSAESPAVHAGASQSTSSSPSPTVAP